MGVSRCVIKKKKNSPPKLCEGEWKKGKNSCPKGGEEGKKGSREGRTGGWRPIREQLQKKVSEK